jgi:hypothetical protein
MRNLAKVDELASVRDVSIAAPDRVTALLAAYYLPRKRLHIFGPEYYPPVSFGEISPARPLLVPDYSCDGVGHADTRTVDGVGCLLFEPPSLSLDTVYPFSRSFLFIENGGLGGREGWGRWNAGREMRLTLTADPKRLPIDRDATYLNLLLQPYLAGGGREQRLRLAWGAGRRAEVRLGEPAWISLPLQPDDWSGEWLATQTVSLDLPDAVTPRPDGRESRPLAVGFLELSVSLSPRGRTVAPIR